MSKVFKISGDIGDAVYAMCAMKNLGGGHLKFFTSSYTREPMTTVKVATIAGFFASQEYVHTVQYDNDPSCDYNLDDFRMTRAKLQQAGPCRLPRPLSLCEIILMTFYLSPTLAQRPWLTIHPDTRRHQPEVIFSRSFRYRNNKFPWKRAHDKYMDIACFLGTENEYREFEGNVGRLPYVSTPRLLDAAQLISTCKLFVGNQNALLAVAAGLRKLIVQETWLAEPNCLFDCVTPGFDSTVLLPDI